MFDDDTSSENSESGHINDNQHPFKQAHDLTQLFEGNCEPQVESIDSMSPGSIKTSALLILQ